MKPSQRPISVPTGFFVAISLILISAAIAAPSTAEGQTLVDQVDIIDGEVDVTENGAVDSSDDATLDDANNVLLLFDDGAPIRVDVIDGGVDVTENGSITAFDDLPDVQVNDDGLPNQFDIINGLLDVNQSGTVDSADDATNMSLVIPSS